MVAIAFILAWFGLVGLVVALTVTVDAIVAACESYARLSRIEREWQARKQARLFADMRLRAMHTVGQVRRNNALSLKGVR